ncbi:unnamed protein product, partial [Cylicostephanus goldi]
DQYQTTVAGGTTTVGGATAIHDREDDDFAIKYRRMEEVIGEDMMNVLCKTTNADGSTEFKCTLILDLYREWLMVFFSDKDIPVTKPAPLKPVDDPAYELQWM